MTRESDGGSGIGRDPCDEKGVQERAAKHYAGWHDCTVMLESENGRERERGGGGERKRKRFRDEERKRERRQPRR